MISRSMRPRQRTRAGFRRTPFSPGRIFIESSRTPRTRLARMREIPPTAWLDRLEERTSLAESAPDAALDAEAVHELRVACGRLIVWLDLGGWRILRDDLRWLRRSAATVRDLDVVLHRFAAR